MASVEVRVSCVVVSVVVILASVEVRVSCVVVTVEGQKCRGAIKVTRADWREPNI